MNKQQIYEYIKQRNIWYEITEHEAVFSMKEVSNIEIPYPEADAKNLFVMIKKEIIILLLLEEIKEQI